MSLTIRPAVEDDAQTILDLILELARYEHEPESVKASVDDLRRDGWGADPCFRAFLADLDGEVVGFALYFVNYSTWEGRRGIYLEDLYVRPTARGDGAGRALIQALAREVVRIGGARLDLCVLDWNEIARDFYDQLDFVDMKKWRPYRLEGEALKRMAEGADAR